MSKPDFFSRLLGGALISCGLLLTACGGNVTLPAVVADLVPRLGGAQQDPGSAADSSAQEFQIVREVNAARASARSCGGVPFAAAGPVVWNTVLGTAARLHAADMAGRDYFAHTSPDGTTPMTRVEAAGYTDWQEIGENIAAGFSVNEVMKSWLDSPSHCKALMNPAFRELGVGYVKRVGSTYGTYWVQDFGTR